MGSQTPAYPSPSVTRTSTDRPATGLSIVGPTRWKVSSVAPGKALFEAPQTTPS